MEPDLNEIQKRLEYVEHKLKFHYVPEADKALETLLETFEPLALQALLREIDAKDLELAMVGLGAKALLQVKGAMSKKSWEMIVDDMAFHIRQGVTAMAAQEARMLVMSQAKRLQEEGKIQLPGGSSGAAEAGRKMEGLEDWKAKVFDKVL